MRLGIAIPYFTKCECGLGMVVESPFLPLKLFPHVSKDLLSDTGDQAKAGPDC